ncbi:MAG: hypothetical protein ABWY16_10880 [Pedobacter sp.]|uniref:hypothetical protein n=1 Tax=Pedobacter sp. TaxID=1411316 RepID=UPI00339A1504
MKKNLLSVTAVILLFLGAACEKDNDEIKATANITVINAAVGTGAVRVNPGAGSGFAYSKASDLGYGSSSVYGAFRGQNTVTVVSATDTTKTLFIRSVELQSINSLYIAGQSPTIDTIFRAEKNLPYIQSSVLSPDSSVYIRFVNLSPNSTPLNITIRAAASNEVSALAYKGISEFKKYASKTASTSYIFEVRDAATNTLRSTLTFNATTNRYKTLSLVIRGLMGTTTGTDAFGIFQVNYFN